MAAKKIAIVGGGAAGFFAAITCAEADPENEVSLYERGSQFLTKVRISGGGRCNVTHACFEPRLLTVNYPRGERPLMSAFHRFSTSDTVDWFEARGVRLKTEADGRMFPVTDSSETIVDCLIQQAKKAAVRLFNRRGIAQARANSDGGFVLETGGQSLLCDRLLLATGGSRAPGSAELLRALGHEMVPPVPSLFSFHLSPTPLLSLPGTSVQDVAVSVVDRSLRARGPLLLTHHGVSGPAILRLSAWGARILAEAEYRFVLRINWLPDIDEAGISKHFQASRSTHPNRRVANSPMGGLPARLWEQLLEMSEIDRETTWTRLPRREAIALAGLLHRTDLAVNGKSLNKEEFVTCGGVNLREVDFKTMASRITPGLHFAGELLDIDGITGGFNFQSAWTTGWIAGRAMAETKADDSR